MGQKLGARIAVSEVVRLSAQELNEVFTAVSDQVRQATDLNSEPAGIQGLMVLFERSPEMGRRLLEFTKALDISEVPVRPNARTNRQPSN